MPPVLDPCRRYVSADPDAPYLRNLAALWTVDPTLAAAIERTPDDATYPIEPAKDGNFTLSVPSSSLAPCPSPLAPRIYLHSKYRPLEESQKLTKDLDFDTTYVFFLHGLGLAYHVKEILDKSTPESVLLCFEPDLALLKTTLSHTDLSEALETRRLLIVAGGDKSALFNRLTPKMALILAGHATLNHPPSLQLHPDFHAQTTRWCDEFIAYARTSINTLVLNGRRTAENIVRNAAWYAATPGVDRLKNRYKGKPAVIVSAGPSLRKNKHLLKGLEDHACLIAVQTTLQPLLEMGVEPHFVTSLDYHEISARFFEKLPKTLRTELVAEPKASKVVFGLHPGPVSLLGNDFAERLLRELNLRKPTLPSGATVAHLAFYLAQHLGCDPIIFVGQDLGFSDGLCYAPGTSYEDVWRPELSRFCSVEMKQWEQIVRERHILRRVEDHEGRPTYTEERLYTYLQQFERDFLQSTTKIIDATEGGVRKRGAESMPLADAIAAYCGSPLSPSPCTQGEGRGESSTQGPITRLSDHPGLNWSLLPSIRTSLETRISEATQIESIAEKTLPLLNQILSNLSNQHEVNRLIAQIDDLRGNMNSLADTYELIVQLTQTTELERFHRDRAIAASRVKGSDKQRRQVQRDIANVKAIQSAAAEFRTLIQTILSELPAQ